MKIRHQERDGRLEIQISDESDWNLFDEIALSLAQKFGGHWAEKLDGLDQRYWDLVVGETTVPLHLEHYLGISLFPAKGNENQEQANHLVRTMAAFLESVGA